MENIDFEYVKEFINSTIESLKDKLDRETIDSVQHYLNHDEYEMAFEGLFIEVMKLDGEIKIDLSKSKEVGRLLKLDEESVFDFEFWKKFDDYTSDNPK